MSKRANPTLIGSFVVGAVVLFAAAILLFAGDKLLAEQRKFVLFFEGSVKGLTIGAPVTFRGVKVGTVTDLQLRVDPSTQDVFIPVYVEIDSNRFIEAGKDDDDVYDAISVSRLIQHGLRAQLQLQSLLTGQLFIQFDFYPGKPATLIGADDHVEELPTIPTPIQEIGKTLQDYDFDEIVGTIKSGMDGFERLVNSAELRQAITHLNSSLKNLNHLIVNIDDQVAPLSHATNQALDEIGQAATKTQSLITDAQTLTNNFNEQVEPLSQNANRTLSSARKTLDSAQGLMAEDSELVYELSAALQELTSAARSIRVLADMLERHPEALVKGKNTGGG